MCAQGSGSHAGESARLVICEPCGVRLEPARDFTHRAALGQPLGGRRGALGPRSATRSKSGGGCAESGEHRLGAGDPRSGLEIED